LADYATGKPVNLDTITLRIRMPPEELLTEEEVELLTSPLDLAAYKNAITEAMFKGTKRYIESEDSSKTSSTILKNSSVG
jgi:hypothetical protein